MLGKLIKHEFRNTRMVGLLLLSAVAMATLMGLLVFLAPMWRSMRSSRYYYDDSVGVFLINMVSVFSIILYVMLLVGAIYAIFIYLVVHFYRSMYTNQGYLLHTLPVTKNQILVSKILVSTIWTFLIYIAMLVSVAIFLLTMVSTISGESIAELLGSMSDFFSQIEMLIREVDLQYQIRIGWYGVLMFANLALGVPSGLIIMFGAVSIGQLFSKHRVLMAIVGYIGILIVRWILSSLFQAVSYAGAMIGGGEEFFGYVNSTSVTNLILNLLLAVGCYLVSYYVTSKRLNMD